MAINRSTSWYRLPNGDYLPLTTTQSLLLDMVPVVEDMIDAWRGLEAAQSAAEQIRSEARHLVIRSRRQRLDVRLVKR